MAAPGPYVGPRRLEMLHLPLQPTSLAGFRRAPLPPPRHQHRNNRTIARSRLADEPPTLADSPPGAAAAADALPDLLPPKFQPFVARNELRRRMMSYCRESRTRDGRLLVVLPLSEPWIPDTADLLTEAFADAMGAVTVYKNFLRRQIRNYLRAHMDLPPKTVVLVAVLVDEAALEAAAAAAAAAEEEKGAGEAADEFDGGMGDGMGAAGPSAVQESTEEGSVPPRWRRLAPGPAATLAAAVEISFTESTRSKDIAGLDPPPERPYLCNMAVARSLQRRGLGAAVLAAAEDLVRAVGDDTVYLHLRFKDAPAAALYRAAGYASVAQDSIFVRLIGQERRWLMMKSLKNEP